MTSRPRTAAPDSGLVGAARIRRIRMRLDGRVIVCSMLCVGSPLLRIFEMLLVSAVRNPACSYSRYFYEQCLALPLLLPLPHLRTTGTFDGPKRFYSPPPRASHCPNTHKFGCQTTRIGSSVSAGPSNRTYVWTGRSSRTRPAKFGISSIFTSKRILFLLVASSAHNPHTSYPLTYSFIKSRNPASRREKLHFHGWKPPGRRSTGTFNR